MAIQLNLEKSKQSLLLNLEKNGITTTPKMDVAFFMDVSGSFDDEHRSGQTNDLMNRLYPWAMVFDPDQELEAYAFSCGVTKVENVTIKNYKSYIQDHVIGCSGYNGGTNYNPAIKRLLADFNWTDDAKTYVRPSFQSVTTSNVKSLTLWEKLTVNFINFFQKLLGKQPVIVVEPVVTTTVPSVVVNKDAPRSGLVFFVTDGDNFDMDQTERTIANAQKLGYKVYFQFICVGTGAFPFPKRLSKAYSNVGLTVIPNMQKWVLQDDDQLNGTLISPSLLTWIKG